MDEKPESLNWRISSWSQSGNCVELAVHQSGVLLRNSKHRQGAHLEFTATEWTAFIAGVKAGEFDFTESNRTTRSDSDS